MKSFPTNAPEETKWDGGYGGGHISPSTLATKLFKAEVPGQWLCCYMLRRFGWPNAGSDDYKELMSWTLTTPIDGLLLGVTPYLGCDGSRKYDGRKKWSVYNLHFSVRFTNEVGRKIDSDPGRDSYFRRKTNAVMGWWKRKGIKLYAWGSGLKEGDEDVLVHTFCDDSHDDKRCFGLWKRTARMKRPGHIPKQAQMVEWWLGELIKKSHPEVKLPKMTAKERRNRHNPFAKRTEIALQRTMLDLLRPTNVRDVDFNIFGKTEEGHSTTPTRLIRGPHAESWKGAGNTPAYWYSPEGIKERAKDNTPK